MHKYFASEEKKKNEIYLPESEEMKEVVNKNSPKKECNIYFCLNLFCLFSLQW